MDTRKLVTLMWEALTTMSPLTGSTGVRLHCNKTGRQRSLTVAVTVTDALWNRMQAAGRHEFPYEMFKNHAAIQKALTGLAVTGVVQQDVSELSAAYLVGEKKWQEYGLKVDTARNFLVLPNAELHTCEPAPPWQTAIKEVLGAQREGTSLQIVHAPTPVNEAQLATCLRLSVGHNLAIEDTLAFGAQRLLPNLLAAEQVAVYV